MNRTIDFSDLAPETQAQLRAQGVKPPRKRKAARFQMEQVRQRALRVLAEVSDLTREQRDRVLRHALRVNDV